MPEGSSHWRAMLLLVRDSSTCPLLVCWQSCRSFQCLFLLSQPLYSSYFIYLNSFNTHSWSGAVTLQSPRCDASAAFSLDLKKFLLLSLQTTLKLDHFNITRKKNNRHWYHVNTWRNVPHLSFTECSLSFRINCR